MDYTTVCTALQMASGGDNPTGTNRVAQLYIMMYWPCDEYTDMHRTTRRKILGRPGMQMSDLVELRDTLIEVPENMRVRGRRIDAGYTYDPNRTACRCMQMLDACDHLLKIGNHPPVKMSLDRLSNATLRCTVATKLLAVCARETRLDVIGPHGPFRRTVDDSEEEFVFDHAVTLDTRSATTVIDRMARAVTPTMSPDMDMYAIVAMTGSISHALADMYIIARTLETAHHTLATCDLNTLVSEFERHRTELFPDIPTTEPAVHKLWELTIALEMACEFASIVQAEKANPYTDIENGTWTYVRDNMYTNIIWKDRTELIRRATIVAQQIREASYDDVAIDYDAASDDTACDPYRYDTRYWALRLAILPGMVYCAREPPENRHATVGTLVDIFMRPGSLMRVLSLVNGDQDLVSAYTEVVYPLRHRIRTVADHLTRAQVRDYLKGMIDRYAQHKQFTTGTIFTLAASALSVQPTPIEERDTKIQQIMRDGPDMVKHALGVYATRVPGTGDGTGAADVVAKLRRIFYSPYVRKPVWDRVLADTPPPADSAESDDKIKRDHVMTWMRRHLRIPSTSDTRVDKCAELYVGDSINVDSFRAVAPSVHRDYVYDREAVDFEFWMTAVTNPYYQDFLKLYAVNSKLASLTADAFVLPWSDTHLRVLLRDGSVSVSGNVDTSTLFKLTIIHLLGGKDMDVIRFQFVAPSPTTATTAQTGRAIPCRTNYEGDVSLGNAAVCFKLDVSKATVTVDRTGHMPKHTSAVTVVASRQREHLDLENVERTDTMHPFLFAVLRVLVCQLP